MTRRRWIMLAALIALAGAAFGAWRALAPTGLPDGIASGNGRIEAVEIDVSTRAAGRILHMLVEEGDFVARGQVLAIMDTAQLEAQRRQAVAEFQRATIAVTTAESLVTQREAERTAAIAVVTEREAELDAATRRRERAEQLAASNGISRQELDDDRAQEAAGQAAVAAAKAQQAAAEAAISTAQSQVLDAQAAVIAAQAAIDRIAADIDDATLAAPRDGRVQYLVAQEGEVVAAGGRVLNMVDLGDVTMSFFLPTEEAGRVAIGAEVRIVLDAAPEYIVPATVSYVADVAQFTPKTVETEEERLKLMFRVKARIPADLLRKYIAQVKTGLPGMAYVRIDPSVEWPAALQGTILE